MKLVHSTALKNFLDIVKGSYNKPCGLWRCSRGDDLMYFYHMQQAMEVTCNEDEEEIAAVCCGEMDIPDFYLNEWSWHGRMQLAFENETNQEFTKSVMFIVEVPEEFYDLVQVDVSGVGMQMCRTIPTDEFDIAWIKEVYITDVSIQHYPFIMASIVNNTEAELDPDDINVVLAKLIARSDDMSALYYDFIEFEPRKYNTLQDFVKSTENVYFMKDAA